MIPRDEFYLFTPVFKKTQFGKLSRGMAGVLLRSPRLIFGRCRLGYHDTAPAVFSLLFTANLSPPGDKNLVR